MNRTSLDDVLDARSLDPPSENERINRLLRVWRRVRLEAPDDEARIDPLRDRLVFRLDEILDARSLDPPSDDKRTNAMLGVWLRARLAADDGGRASRVRVLLLRRLEETS